MRGVSISRDTTRRRCACAVLTDADRAAQGLAPGYCGRCRRCGAPGHLRPRDGPFGGAAAWCDTHAGDAAAIPLAVRIVPVVVSLALCLLVAWLVLRW